MPPHSTVDSFIRLWQFKLIVYLPLHYFVQMQLGNASSNGCKLLYCMIVLFLSLLITC